MWGQAVERICERQGLSVEAASDLFGHSRQAYYQQRDRNRDHLSHERTLVKIARSLREQDAGIGRYKMWRMIQEAYMPDWMPGRDAFFKIMDRYGLTLPRPRPRHTTNSNHRFHRFKNLTKGLELTQPNQLWVSDITYIDIANDSHYLHLVTDAYSHKIIGWCFAESLSAKHTLDALRMAIAQTGKEDLHGLIHHSDRGIQYCCNAYVEELESHGISISMTEDYKPTDNAVAERANGIIKQELIYRRKQFASYEEAKEAIERFITFYNNDRPHMSIGFQTPTVAHQQVGAQQRHWKGYYERCQQKQDNECKQI